MENLIRGVNQECFESCVFTVYVGVLGQGTRYSNDNASLLLQPTLLAGATTPCRLAIQLLNAAFRQSIPSLSPLTLLHYTTINNTLFLAEWPFQLVQASPLSSAENHCSIAQFKSHTTNQNSTMRTGIRRI
jgi:hypothetical protein